MLHYNGFIKESINEGSGLRCVLFTSGCNFACKGCHNKPTWNPEYGKPFTKEVQTKIINYIKSNPLLSGITFCGGESLFYPTQILEFIWYLKSEIPNINIWMYSGYTYEEILVDPVRKQVLREIDVLIDGRFIEAQKDLTLKFKGSTNQRIINVQESLKQNKIILEME